MKSYKPVVLSLFALLLSSVSMAQSQIDYRYKLAADIEKAKKSLIKTEGKAVKAILSMDDVNEDLLQRTTKALKESNAYFLQKTLTLDCSVKVLAEGSVGGSAYGVGMQECELNAIQNRESDLKAMFELK